jgi:hypothetical protein
MDLREAGSNDGGGKEMEVIQVMSKTLLNLLRSLLRAYRAVLNNVGVVREPTASASVERLLGTSKNSYITLSFVTR